MGSDTDTRNSRRILPFRAPELDGIWDIYWGGPERRITGLTVRIIAANFVALLTLLLGVVYLSQYQSALIENKLKTFQTEINLISIALSQDFGGENDGGLRGALSRLNGAIGQRILVFNAKGDLVSDTDALPGGTDEILKKNESVQFQSIEILKQMAGFLIKFLPETEPLPMFPDAIPAKAQAFFDTASAIKGEISISAWRMKNREIVLTAAAPILKEGKISGAALIVRTGEDIQHEIGEIWINILGVFFLTLIFTILLSIYLAGAIGNPLRKLAKAAESLRSGNYVEIPDLSHRKDEIGELSVVLREMTDALWQKMDATENFAADVAHELKNPLTSLRSAIETLGVVKTDKDRQKLMQIARHDIDRMDRLITDISNASRLEAELSREAMEDININTVARRVIETHTHPSMRSSRRGREDVKIILQPSEKDYFVRGLEGRLFQLLDNLISNAVSFSPAGGEVKIHIAQDKKIVTVTVEDQGPGIPDKKLETIFDRFYTERPEHEAFGTHSGLGLSICRQIVTALGGRIWAENIYGLNKNVPVGARFCVHLNAV